MRLPALLAYLAVMLVLSAGSFLVGFAYPASPEKAAEVGLTFGILSGAAWGVGSIGGPPNWNNWSNVFAALFAALSLGFLAPAAQACKGANGLIGQACALRTYLR